MTTPTGPRDNDDSARDRDRDQPTEYFGTPGHTSDPGQAYGQSGYNPTEALPAGDWYAQQPPYEQGYPQQQQYPTQGYPTQGYPTQQGHPQQQGYPAQQGYPTQGYSPYQQPPYQQNQYGEAPFLENGDSKPPRGPKTALIVVAALVVIALIGTGAYLLYDSTSSSRTAAPAITPRSAPPTTTAPPSTSVPPLGSLPGLEQIPGGVGEALGSQGASVGTIISNDGTTIVMDGIGGSTVTVVTNANTQILALGAATVADLAPGTSIVVQGTPLADGSITAEVIVSAGIGFN
ncbi:hypothetical protein [Rhodococcus sp. BP-241]|nr:hypothetical protein [Rhodococcus sp. BP-241]